MKFLLPLALLAATGVSAQTTAASSGSSSDCEADYIVEQCLTTEQAKAAACLTTDYDCLCAAWQAIATCYNNCPQDQRGTTAKNQVVVFCQNASIYGEAAAKASKTSKAAKAAASETASEADSSETAESTSSSSTEEEDEEDSSSAKATSSTTATASAESADNTGGAAELARNTGGVLLAVAGVVVAML